MAKKSNDTAVLYENVFLPCAKGSPEVQSKTKNLTGSARKVKDCAADLYNIVQKWNKTNQEGMEIIKTIANIKLANINQDIGEDVSDQSKNDEMPTQLEEHCNTLKTIMSTFVRLVSKMEALQSTYKGLSQLHKFKGQVDEHDTVLFQSWKLQDFENTVGELLEMYRKELKLKQLISENICHTADRNTMLFYTASWLHQPYIEDSGQLLLESLLVETGHK